MNKTNFHFLGCTVGLLSCKHVLSVLFFSGGRQHTACCFDVFSPGGTYGADDTLAGKGIAECDHFFFGRAVQIYLRYGMEPYEVDTAIEAMQQMSQFVDVSRGIVDTFENDVFERETALVAEIVLS